MHFVFVSKGREMMVVVCGCGSVGVLMRFVWRSLGVGMGVLGWVGCVFGGVGERMNEFWTSGIVYMLILAISMSTVPNSIRPKSISRIVVKSISGYITMYCIPHTRVYISCLRIDNLAAISCFPLVDFMFYVWVCLVCDIYLTWTWTLPGYLPIFIFTNSFNFK